MSTLDDEIVHAFPPKTLSASIFIDAQSHWNKYVHASQFATGCEGKCWNQLPLPFLTFHEDALRWLPPGAFVEIIPAYLSAALNLPPDADRLITESLVTNLIRRKRRAHLFDARMDRLNQIQRDLMVTILSTILDDDRDAGDIHHALDNLRTLPENAASLRMPDGPTTSVLPLPAQYAQLEHDLLAAFPPQTFCSPAIAQWKEWVDRGSQYIGNMALEEAIMGKVWGALSLEFVLIHEFALQMLKPEGYAALVPAYLAALLHNRVELRSLVYNGLRRRSDDDVLFATRTKTLDRAQRQVIVRVFAILKGQCERPEPPIKTDADWIAMNIHSAYDGWCSVIDGPPNVKTFSDPVPPPEFETQHLLQQIRDAFPLRVLSRDHFINSLTPGQLEYHLDDDAKRFLDRLDGHSWDTLSPTLLTHYHSELITLQWLIPDAFDAVLPAYLELLAYADEGPEDILWVLTRREERKAEFDSMVQRLNEPQRRVVAHLLEAITHESHRFYRWESEKARTALAHWRETLPS